MTDKAKQPPATAPDEQGWGQSPLRRLYPLWQEHKILRALDEKQRQRITGIDESARKDQP